MVKLLEVAERDQLIGSICQGVMDGELDFATAVRRLRVEVTGLNQAPFARMCRISLGALLQLEHGTGNPTLKTLDSVFRVFGLRMSLAMRTDARA
jgi:transcriptional regulator with XRE-family HTH domain